MAGFTLGDEIPHDRWIPLIGIDSPFALETFGRIRDTKFELTVGRLCLPEGREELVAIQSKDFDMLRSAGYSLGVPASSEPYRDGDMLAIRNPAERVSGFIAPVQLPRKEDF